MLASEMPVPISRLRTVRHRGMGTGISEANKRVPIFESGTGSIESGTGSKLERLRTGSLQADLSLIV